MGKMNCLYFTALNISQGQDKMEYNCELCILSLYLSDDTDKAVPESMLFFHKPFLYVAFDI